MQAEFVFKGTSLTGTVILADPANATVVPVTGTVKGNQLTASGHSVVGTDVTFTGTITSAEITGTYNNNTADTGTFTLTKTTGVTTPTLTKIATDWGGDYITGSTDVPLNLMFTQSGNDLSVHGTTGFGGFGNPGTFFTGNGAIIGNNLAIVFAGPNNVLTYFIGTFNGAVVAGASQDTQGHTGQFRVAPPQ